MCDGKTLDKKPDGEIQRLLNGGDDGARQHLSPDLSAEQIMSLLPLSACAELSSVCSWPSPGSNSPVTVGDRPSLTRTGDPLLAVILIKGKYKKKYVFVYQ